MPIAGITLPAEKRALREKMRALGLGHREIAAEFARRYRLRPPRRLARSPRLTTWVTPRPGEELLRAGWAYTTARQKLGLALASALAPNRT
jgi:hypothetical protein